MSNEIVRLIDKCLSNDEIAIQTLVNRFRSQVFQLCYRFLGQHHDAEDAVQETFTRVVRSLSTWNRERDFEPWLMTIAANRCRTLLSKRQRKPIHQPIHESDVNDLRPVQTQQAEWLQEELTRSLGQLKTEWRQAFLLFHQQQYSYQEIADEMGCSLGTVKTWVHRARKQLISTLQKREAV
ncbi:MAG: RNA polymerase sigma factor [Planctomycetales bacterium]|nr:RNA polymerase sigma factor [Planctomycetales bacterium]